MLHTQGITHKIISEELKQMKIQSKKKIKELLIPTSLKLPLQGKNIINLGD